MIIQPDKIGRAIKTLRLARNLRQEQLAQKLGVSANYLSLLENGKRGITLPRLNALSSILNVPASFITFMGSEVPDGDEAASRLFVQIGNLIETAVGIDAEDETDVSQ